LEDYFSSVPHQLCQRIGSRKSRLLQDIVMSDNQNSNSDSVFADGILGSVYFGPIFLVVALFLLVCICFTQEFIYHRYGIEMFPGYLGPRVAQQRRRQQEMLDHELLAQAQRHRRLPSNQLVREREEERKRTYQEFLKPYTMVVADNDLSLGEVGLNDDAWVQKKFEIMEQGESSWWSKECNRELGAQGETADFPQQTKSDRKNDEKEIWKEPKLQIKVDICAPVMVDSPSNPNLFLIDACEGTTITEQMELYSESEVASIPFNMKELIISADHDNMDTKTINANDESRPNECPVNDLGSWRMSVYPPPERMLCLPVTDEYGRSRKVIAECVICIMEYEIGDQVVWSTSRLCQHAFHSDCILAWISKAKKRCPICRNFFVPIQSLDNGKVVTQDENDLDAPIGFVNISVEGNREQRDSTADGTQTREETGVEVAGEMVVSSILQHGRSSLNYETTSSFLEVGVEAQLEEQC